ncbi:methionine--tRNA ligase [Candidatus Woesearchaeota archaeon]|nr:methionine--tRNA ligase [Candidatus Woesearchaeota archaeon]
MVKKKFYITTPVYYTNSSPHVGSAYTTIAADVLARWHKLKSENVFFLTGTDEHGQKIQEVAEEKKIKPKEFVDKIANEFKDVFRLLNISNDNFIRTTDKQHEKEVKKILQELYRKKYIYKGYYESYYCVGCEQYLTESDLVDGKCVLHNREPELRKEEAYLFRLSKFQDRLLNLIKSGKYSILPERKRKEIVSFIESGLKDISISRRKEKVYWGIELPFDKNHTAFVWIDAFWNYITGLKIKKQFNKFWPADVQLMANDILRVHATIWPALLLATGNKLPKKLFVHGYFTVNGQKMSKSLDNVISPEYLVKEYGVDSLRYFLMRQIPFGQDGDFSEEALRERLNNELANELGNFVSRILGLSERNFKSIKKYAVDQRLSSKLNVNKISKFIDKFELHNALNEIMNFVRECNRHINQEKLWDKRDEDLEKHMYSLLESIRIISILLYSFMPETSEKINAQLKIKMGKLKDCKFGIVKKYKIKKEGILFKKIDVQNPPTGEVRLKDKLTFEDFDFRVAEIKGVKDHPNADKLYVLLLDLGKETADDVQIVSGIKEHYKKEELIGKKIILLKNLKKAVIRGVESQGMLLAVSDGKRLSLLTAPKGRNGERIFIDLREKARDVVEITDFEKLKLLSKNGKIIYNNEYLRTEEEEVKLDKKMKDGLRVN